MPTLQTSSEMLAALDTFTRAYIAAALWSSTDDEGNPLDDNYGPEDLAPVTLATMIEDCAAFQRDCAMNLEASGLSSEQAGHDFWLTRNHHGAGYWDRGLQADVGRSLTDDAHTWGSFDLYIGDDGQIYGN